RSLGVEGRIEFSGQLDRAGVKEAYGESDAVLFPPRWREPWGLVPLEAMARGTPVVATPSGGSIEYLRDGENCLLSAPDDPRDLAAKLTRLAADEELRERLRENGLALAPQHTEQVFNASVAREIEEAATEQSEPRLRILHVGSGFRPMRFGGLTA